MNDARDQIEDEFLSLPNNLADPRFVAMCRHVYTEFVTGRMNRAAFTQACDDLDVLAKQIEKQREKKKDSSFYTP